MGLAFPSRADLLALYKTIAHIRACDEVIRTGISRGRLTYFYFPVTGHEAVAAGVSQALKKDDYLVVTYRGMHHQLAKGVSFESILGEMTGKSTAVSGGKSGAMHICVPEVGLMMTTGIVGGGLAPAVGLALANKVRRDKRVTVCCFGDGAINTGSFHEALNLAAVWQLPVVFVCENNRFAENTPTHLTYRGTITGRAQAYTIRAETVDGYDPVAVYGAVRAAVARALNGEGPSLIEATCFRFFGHYFGDQMLAVPPEQLKAEREKDPFLTYKSALVQLGYFTEQELNDIKAKADAEAKAVLERNVAAPGADPKSVFEGAYSNPIHVRS